MTSEGTPGDWSDELVFEEIKGRAADAGGLWRVLVELAPDGIFLETVHGEILAVNEAGARMFGYTPEEMIGLGIADLVPEDFGKTLPKEITQVTGPSALRRYNRRKDGTIFPTEISTRFVSLEGEKRLLAYVRDITESVEAFGELQAALDKVEALFGIIPICMHCGQVRDDKGYWSRVDEFVTEHAGIRFSHGLCPTCLPKHYPDFVEGAGPAEKGGGVEEPSRSR